MIKLLRFVLMLLSLPVVWIGITFGLVGFAESLKDPGSFAFAVSSSFIAGAIIWIWFLVDTFRK